MGRKHRSPEEKAKIALEALREDKPLRWTPLSRPLNEGRKLFHPPAQAAA